MKQCVKCGARGLFLPLDQNGICDACKFAEVENARKEKRRQFEEQLTAATVYHEELVEIYKKLPDDFMNTISSDTAVIRRTVAIFDELLRKLSDYTQYPRFQEVFLSYLTPKDNYGFSNHTVFRHRSIYLSFKPDNEVVSSYMEEMIKTINNLRDDYLNVARETDWFYRLLSNVERVSIATDIVASSKRYLLQDFPDVEPVNLTKRTPESTTSDFIVIDLETTGLKPSINEIIELCAVRFEGGAPVACYETYVRPMKGLKEEAQRINGITEQKVENAPAIEQVLNGFETFIGKTLPLVGHNILFDLKFLHTHGSNIPSTKRKMYDTCSLAKKAFPDSEYSLDALCGNKLRIARTDAHSALSDCIATGLLLIEIKNEIDRA